MITMPKQPTQRYRLTVVDWTHDNFILSNTHAAQTMRGIRFQPVWNGRDGLQFRKLVRAAGLPPGTDDLVRIALVAGPYSTLWIEDLNGTIAPMDVEPQGWIYPNGEPAEPAWFWQWYPSETAQQKMLADLHDPDPLRELSADRKPKYFKGLVPFDKARNYGEIQAINGINLQQLPDMMRRGLTWTFEFDADADAALRR